MMTMKVVMAMALALRMEMTMFMAMAIRNDVDSYADDNEKAIDNDNGSYDEHDLRNDQLR